MWFMANMGFLHTLGRLAADDTPTQQPPRDVFTYWSAQDCVNLLRFSQDQVRILVGLNLGWHPIDFLHILQINCSDNFAILLLYP